MGVVLAMTLNGANGETLDSMKAVLRLTGLSESEVNQGYQDVIALLRGLDSRTEMLVANSMWGHQGFELEPAFVETGRAFFDAEIRTLDFGTPDAMSTINDWVSRKTNGRIPKLLESISREEILFLINAIYFKGRWRSGFDPGVTNVFCAHAQKHRFSEIHTVDIMDANAGDHGYPFATNFNPEINIREITANGRYWENGEWKETGPLEVHKTWDFPEIGPKEMYLMYHEEMESLAKNLKGLKRIRFWMTFSEKYLTHLRVLENVGMTSIKPVLFEGKEIIPLQFLKAVLPDPASLGPRTKGKTNIGCLIEGLDKDGKHLKTYTYNVCDHEACYAEVESQAISYTTGVPAMIGAMMMVTGKWKQPGVWNMEELDPDPFMEALNKHGLPWTEEIWQG
jgi:hypothetical protein